LNKRKFCFKSQQKQITYYKFLIPFIHNTQLQITFGLFQKIKPTLKGQGFTTAQAIKKMLTSEVISQEEVTNSNSLEQAGRTDRKAPPPLPTPKRLL
jgi:hypothetical protein